MFSDMIKYEWIYSGNVRFRFPFLNRTKTQAFHQLFLPKPRAIFLYKMIDMHIRRIVRQIYISHYHFYVLVNIWLFNFFQNAKMLMVCVMMRVRLVGLYMQTALFTTTVTVRQFEQRTAPSPSKKAAHKHSLTKERISVSVFF